MTLILENLKATKKRGKTNPESFLQGLPAFVIPKESSKKVEGLLFNNEAIEYTNLFKQKGDKILDRLVFIPNYLVKKQLSVVIDLTTEKEIALDKKYSSYRLNKNTKTLSSKSTYKMLVDWFKLDTAMSHTFVLEKHTSHNEEFFKVLLHENFVLDEGQDLPIVLLEEEQKEEEITNKPNINN